MTARRAAGAVDAELVTLDHSVDLDAELPELWRVSDAARRDAGEIDRSTLEGMSAYYRNLDHCDPSTDLVIARRGTEVIGYARIEWSDSTDGERWYAAACFVHPDARGTGVGRRLLDWSEERRLEVAAGQASEAPDRRRWLTTFLHDGDRAGAALLRSAGYEPFRTFHSMRRPDLEAIPDLPLPAGIEVRPVPNEPAAIRAIVAADSEAFQDHFGSVDDTDTVYRMIVEDPGTDLSLWVVAFDGDEVAGAVLNGIRPSADGEPVGWLDSIFTRRPWRKRGLARSLIARSLGVLRERGATSAALGVDAANPNRALALYESCGFVVASSSTAYRKPLPAPTTGDPRRS